MLTLEMFLAATEALVKVRPNANRTLQQLEVFVLMVLGLDWLVTLSSLECHKRKPNDCVPALAQRLLMRESSESCALAGARFVGCSTTLGITTVQIEILGAKCQLGPRCAPHYSSGPSQNLLSAKNQFA